MNPLRTEVRVAAVAVAAFATFAAAPPAFADRCVDPAGAGGCDTTIQDAIDLAAAGETIRIGKGFYLELLTIPVDKPGLVLEGAGTGKVFVDGGPPLATDPLLDVRADGVVVRDITFQNAGSCEGVRILGTFDDPVADVTFDGLRVRAAKCSHNIEVRYAADVAIVDSVIEDCPSDCIDVSDAERVRIEKNLLRIIDNNGVRLFGCTDCSIVKNTIADVEDSDAINVSNCPAIRIEGNRLVRVDDGIELSSSPGYLIAKNRIQAGDDEAIRVSCPGCAGTVSGNRIEWAGDDSDGIQINSGPGTLVERNRVDAAASEGIDISGDGIVIRGNRVANFGYENEAGFRVSGTNHALTGNVAASGGGDGFNVTGSGHVLTGNTASGNMRDGFDIRSTNTILIDNTAIGNVAEGFDIDTDADVTLADNEAKGNRAGFDFCDDSLFGVIDAGGNSFTIPGAPACLID